MSLHIYRDKNDIPKEIRFIKDNNTFFDNNTMLLDNYATRDILKEIDQSTYVSELTYISRATQRGALFKENLSTGAKILLNILNHPDKCFSMEEVGYNVEKYLKNITDGYVYWKTPVIANSEYGDKCDILIENQHFLDWHEFVRYCMTEEE